MILALLALCAAHAEPLRGEVLAGWSGGPSRMYGYLEAEPVLARHDAASLALRVTSSYLRYESFDDLQQPTRVDSPGLALGAAFSFAPDRLSLGIATGVEGRRSQDATTATGRHGLDIGATIGLDATWRPDPRAALSAGGSFTGANRYFFGRVGARRQVVPLYRRDPANALWLGVDATGQGNGDARYAEAGVLGEVVVTDWKLSFTVRGDFGVEDLGGLKRPSARLGGAMYRWF